MPYAVLPTPPGSRTAPVGASHTLLGFTVQAAWPGVWGTNCQLMGHIHAHVDSQKLPTLSTDHLPAAADLSEAYTGKLAALDQVYKLCQVAWQTDVCGVCSTCSKLASTWAHSNTNFSAITHLFWVGAVPPSSPLPPQLRRVLRDSSPRW